MARSGLIQKHLLKILEAGTLPGLTDVMEEEFPLCLALKAVRPRVFALLAQVGRQAR